MSLLERGAWIPSPLGAGTLEIPSPPGRGWRIAPGEGGLRVGGEVFEGDKMTTSEAIAFWIFVIMTMAFFIWVGYLAFKK